LIETAFGCGKTIQVGVETRVAVAVGIGAVGVAIGAGVEVRIGTGVEVADRAVVGVTVWKELSGFPGVVEHAVRTTKRNRLNESFVVMHGSRDQLFQIKVKFVKDGEELNGSFNRSLVWPP
jgi:hypothetical protein